MLVTSICPAPSFATASTISHFLLEMYILVFFVVVVDWNNIFVDDVQITTICQRQTK